MSQFSVSTCCCRNIHLRLEDNQDRTNPLTTATHARGGQTESEPSESALIFSKPNQLFFRSVIIGRWSASPDRAGYVQLSVVPQEMQNSSVALTLELAADTARLADEGGTGVASTAATALVEVIGQVCRLLL